jgi:penicillin-binding protein-related factor A (putative recombinase)
MRAQRGRFLEAQIESLLNYLNSNGIHAHKNYAHRTIEGVFLSGEPFDYEIFTNPVHVFDAKETQQITWNLQNAKPHQIKHLLDCKNHGAEAYFLVLFQNQDFRRFDVDVVRQALIDGRKSLGKDEGTTWNYQQFLNR